MSARPYATFADVQRFIKEDRLHVDPITGHISKRRQRGAYQPVKREKVIAPGHRDGYYRVVFCNMRGLEHRIVWFALKGPIPEGMTVNHKDGNKLNNRPENLELMTHAENNAHAIETGLLDPTTPKNWSLTADQVREIRRLVEAGTPQAQVARDFSITTNVVNRIVKRKTYASVD